MQAESREEINLIGHALYPVLLCAAAGTGDTKGVSQILEMGGNPNCSDYDGRSPLHIAASEGNLEVVDLLLDVGASVHSKDRFGHNALYDAVMNRHPAVVELLFKTGAQFDLEPTKLGLILCTYEKTIITHPLKISFVFTKVRPQMATLKRSSCCLAPEPT